MPSPKSGCEVPPDEPVVPKPAHNALNDKAGKPAEKKDPDKPPSGGGVPGSTKVKDKPGGGDTPPGPSEDEPTHWISLNLKDDKGKPVANESFIIKASDGTEHPGATDADGKAKVSDLPAGQCQISFPRISKSELKKA